MQNSQITSDDDRYSRPRRLGKNSDERKEQFWQTVWRFPETWEIKSKRGYWKRTVSPLLEAGYKGFGLKVATRRYINPFEPKQTRTGAEFCDEQNAEVDNIAETTSKVCVYIQLARD